MNDVNATISIKHVIELILFKNTVEVHADPEHSVRQMLPFASMAFGPLVITMVSLSLFTGLTCSLSYSG